MNIGSKDTQIDYLNGHLIHCGVRYPLRLNGKIFSPTLIDPPKWHLDTIMDISKNRNRWNVDIDSIGPCLNRDGLEIFGQIDDCMNELSDQEFNVGVVYDSSVLSIYIPWEYFKKESSTIDKIKSIILKRTRYLFHSKCEKEFIIRKNKWLKWTCEVCDLSICEIRSYLSSDQVIIKFYPKDVENMIDDILNS
jgi:hypothetical protein